jgi:hypothetical protein
MNLEQERHVLMAHSCLPAERAAARSYATPASLLAGLAVAATA